MKKISRQEKNYREATTLTLDLPPPAFDVEDDLCARAAWLYYGAGLTQGEVAKRLNVPSVKAHRLVARANRLGLVRVSIDAPVGSCMQLEDELQRKYGLSLCVLAPDSA